MNITIQHTEGCPNLEPVEARVREALQQLEMTADIGHELVRTSEDAGRLGFTGSPTILIGGRDPFAKPGAKPALACRNYGSDGPNGAPTVEELRRAIEAAAG